MKRHAVYLLTLILLFAAAVPVTADANASQVTVGDCTAMTGVFSPDFSATQADMNMAMLLIGCRLMPVDADGRFCLNRTAVKSLTLKQGKDGGTLYDIVLNQGLTWTDGKPVTAKDYVASCLLRSSAAYEECGGCAEGGYYLLGYWEFYDGSASAFKGVHLKGEYEFTLELEEENSDTFYQDSYIDLYPIRLDKWAPGFEVKETSGGAKFNKKLTAKAIASSVEKELHAPSVTCGAYTLESYDAETQTAVFRADPGFRGDFEGRTPSVETVVYRSIPSEIAAEELRTGGVDILLNVTGADGIAAGKALTEQGGFYDARYPGLSAGWVYFDCAKGAAASAAVRKAVAKAFDREDYARRLAGGYAEIPEGDFTGSLFGARVQAEKLEKALDPYAFDPEAASALLDADGWIYDKDGGAYTPAAGGYRYKKEADGSLAELSVYLGADAEDASSAVLIGMLSETLPKIGVHFEAEQMERGVLMQYIYGDPDSPCNMYADRQTFRLDYAPALGYTLDPTLTEAYNLFHVRDEALYTAATAIEMAEPGDEKEYLESFFRFNVRWNELLPAIPLFAEETYCFVGERVRGWTAGVFTTAEYSLLRCTAE